MPESLFPSFSGSILDFIPRMLGITPANAEPLQQPGQMQQPQMGPLSMGQRLPEALGGFWNGGMMQMNPVRGALNAITTLATGQRTDPQSIQQNNARMIYQNLRQNGLDHNQAMMAIMNPKANEAAGTELMKSTISPSLTTAPDGSLIVMGPFGKAKVIGGVPISDRNPDVVNPDGSKSPGGYGVKPSLTNPTGYNVMPGQGAPQRPLTPPAPRAAVPGAEDPTMTVSPSQVARANAPITELSPRTKNEMETGGKNDASLSEGYRTAGVAAGKKLSTLARMSQLSDTAYEGKGGPAQLYVRSLLTSFGMPASKNATASEELEALTNKMVLDANNGSLGAGVSNADVSFIKDMQPSVAHTADGRREIIATATAIARREQQVAKMAQEWEKKNGTIRGFDVALAQWAEQNPLFNFNDRFSAAGRSPSGETNPSAIQEGRTATNPKTGQKIIFKGGQWQPL